MSRLISFAVLIAIIIVIGLLFYKVLIGFFIPVFLAAVLVVVFRPLHRWVLERSGHRDRLAAVVTTFLIMLILFLPFGFVVTAASVQGLRLIEQNDSNTVLIRINKIRDSLGLQMPDYRRELESNAELIDEIVQASSNMPFSVENENLKRMGTRVATELQLLQKKVTEKQGQQWEEEFERLIELSQQIGQPNEDYLGKPLPLLLKSDFETLRTNLLGGSLLSIARRWANPTEKDVQQITQNAFDYVRPKLLSITGATGAFLVQFVFGSVILVVATFFFLYDGPSMIKTIMYLSPLDDNYEQELLLEFDRVSRAVVVATILSAVVQGLTAGVGYAVAGINYLALLVMLTTMFAMVPFVGPAIVWVPVCLYLGLYEDRILAAVLLGLWGTFVVGTVDNVVKAFVLHGQSQLHPLLALLSVLGGVQALGPVGIVVGPMVVALLQTLLSILQRELGQFDGEGWMLSDKKDGDPRARLKAGKKEEAAAKEQSSANDDESQTPDDQEAKQETKQENHKDTSPQPDTE